MKGKHIIQEKTFVFAIHIVNLDMLLIKEKNDYVLTKQLLRSGISIGANIKEPIGGQYSADFYSKLTIAYKEVRETAYWLKLFSAANYLSEV
jgi:four helix bundle protein